MNNFVSSFTKDGDTLTLTLNDSVDVCYIAIDSEKTFHNRPYTPIVITDYTIDTDYFIKQYHNIEDSGTREYQFGIMAAAEDYTEKEADECNKGISKVSDYLEASIYIAQVYDTNGNHDIVYIIDWEKFYNYILSLLNKCDCSQCKPPLELITTILAYYSMHFNMLNGDIARFIKVWDKTMKATSITNCSCNDR